MSKISNKESDSLMLNASYLPLDQLYDAYCSLAQEFPEYCHLEEIGRTRKNHPIYLITLTDFNVKTPVDHRMGFWLDAGTHSAEWAGISAALYSVSRWIERIQNQDQSFIDWLQHHVIYCVPCLSPDGYEALWQGTPYLRSTLRDSRIDRTSIGLTTQDINGDGKVRWMRWKHPAGPLVEDPEHPGLMRGRQIGDDPNQAYFMSMEGYFEHWDGWAWQQSPRDWVESLDLNRNFPAHWQNFQMFGMDGGLYALSETESRVVVDAFAQRPLIGAAITNHTFTGAILTQPYRVNHGMSAGDIKIMDALAQQCVKGTNYRVIKVYPDFTYDEDNEVVGVWSDTLSSTFGVPGYTLELWDPFKYCGIPNENPASFFKNPNPEQLRQLVLGFKDLPDLWMDWQSFEHPQLGHIELGGLDFMMSIRNPPLSELQSECERAYNVADRMRQALPKVQVKAHYQSYTSEPLSVLHSSHDGQTLSCLTFQMENLGFLSTSSLEKGKSWAGCPALSAHLKLPDTMTLVQGKVFQSFEHLAGWGHASLGLGGLSPSLDGRGHRQQVQWWIQGHGDAEIIWSGGRGGRGKVVVNL